LLPVVLIGLPLALLAYESQRTGLSIGDVVARIKRQASEGKGPGAEGTERRGEAIPFLKPQPIGDTPAEKSTISHVAIYDLDQDGLKDVLVCDVLHRRVTWIRQEPLGVYTERTIAAEVSGAAHVEACDIDRDGDLDVVVAVMTMILPNNDRVGKVLLLENDGRQNFTPRVLAERIARVTDVQCGDLDGDGDIDLAVGQFGYDQGEIRWMRNDGDWRFTSEVLLSLSGTIHTPIVDLDGDLDLDIVALVSQEWEEVYAFENDGKGRFRSHILYGVADDDYGSSGIGTGDLDADGDADIIWANGDAFVATDYRPLPSHGVQWLENLGGMTFAFHRLGKFPGAYDPCAADLDGDGDLDVLAVSGFNYWERPGAQSMMWWQNQGGGVFVGRALAEAPTHLITVDVADMNGDGRIDAVTGSMNLYPPFDRIGRITLWLNEWDEGVLP
jgi:hypothetical protein